MSENPVSGGKVKLTLENASEDNPTLAEFLARRRDTPDRLHTDFAILVVFQSHQQKDEFVYYLPPTVLLVNEYVVDGQNLCQSLGIPITPNTRKPIDHAVNPAAAEMALYHDQVDEAD